MDRGGRLVGLYASKNHGQQLALDRTSPAALYLLSARGVSGSVVSLYVLYDGTDFDAEPVEVRPDKPPTGLRRAKAEDLVLLDANALLGASGTKPQPSAVAQLAAAFFSDLEIRKWAGVVDSEQIDERVAGFVARVGGTTENKEDQASRIAMIWHLDSSKKAIAMTFETLHLEAKAEVALHALESPGVAQLLTKHFSQSARDDSWRKKFNVHIPLSSSAVDALPKTTDTSRSP